MALKKAKSFLERLADSATFEAPEPIDLQKHIASKATDEVKAGVHDAWEQLLGSNKDSGKQHGQPKGGDLKPGEAISLDSHKNKKDDHEKPTHTEKKSPVRIEAGYDYRREIIHGSEIARRSETRELDAKLKEIINELNKLASSSKLLQSEFKEVTVDQRITKPGKYHVSFFEWVLIVVKNARMRVEDSGAWLAAMKSKKKSKGYWEQFKKKGTSFALSNERNVATQTG